MFESFSRRHANQQLNLMIKDQNNKTLRKKILVLLNATHTNIINQRKRMDMRDRKKKYIIYR